MKSTIKEMRFLFKELSKTNFDTKTTIAKTNQNKMAEQILNNLQNKPSIMHSTNHEKDILATYYPGTDFVIILPKKDFRSPQHYYRTLFHELAHATGHKTRIERKTIGMKKPRKQQVLYEELTAEFSAIQLCKKCRIYNKVKQDIARNIIYILNQIKETNWEKRLECYENAIKATKYILGEQNESQYNNS